MNESEVLDQQDSFRSVQCDSKKKLSERRLMD